MSHWPRAILIVFCALAVLCNGYTLKEAFKDLWIETRVPSMAFVFQIAAWRSLRNEVATFFLQGVLLYLRVWSTTWPDPNSPQFVIRWRIDMSFVTLCQVVLAINCIWNMIDRRRIFYSTLEQLVKENL